MYDTKLLDDISRMHSGDIDQLDFIFSDKKRIVLEAPAGYGKTRTMISKIAFQLATSQVPMPKKILALTFSVNAAYKIKKDITEQIPIILHDRSNDGLGLVESIFVSNFHGLCRRILRRYGFKLHSNLKNIDDHTTFDDSSELGFRENNINLSYSKIELLNQFSQAIRNHNYKFLKENIEAYNHIYFEDLLPNNFISYTAILTLTITLLKTNEQIRLFYQKLFPIIYIDEFQDTNVLSYSLIKLLIDQNTSVFVCGDPLQRIYGFIGAMTKLMERVKVDLVMEGTVLQNNYRFRGNKEMLLLDFNVRRNAESLITPNIDLVAKIDLSILENQDEEATYITQKCMALLTEFPESRISILFRGGSTNKNTSKIIEEFDRSNINYFFGMFSDEDAEYRQYHREAYFQLVQDLAGREISKRICRSVMNTLKKEFKGKSPIHDSLLVLTEIFFKRLFIEYNYLSEEERGSFAKETFEGLGLKQYLEYVDSRIVLSTIHGAKGLEWDFVLMPDMEQFSLPSWFGSCEHCGFKDKCIVNFNTQNEGNYLDELSVFYVGFTRARKQVFFTASKEGITSTGRLQTRNLSCFLNLKGIEY